nr:hypothetical protein [Tanacetum cinerariifolium]
MIGSLMYVTLNRPDIMFATCLWYPKDSGFDLTAYSDADHAGCHLDQKKSKYVVVSGCCAQVLWMRTQLTDYGFFYDKVPIYYDSKSAIAISCNPAIRYSTLGQKSATFRIYNKRTRKIHESVNVNFDELSEMASKQFSLEPDLSKLNETGKSSNPSVSQVSESSKKDLEDLFQDFYDEYFDSLKIMKSSITNVETSIDEEVFHEVSESFQGESSSSLLNDAVQQSPEEVILPQTNTQSISFNMVPNSDEASTSHNVFNEQLEDTYFDVSTSFQASSL